MGWNSSHDGAIAALYARRVDGRRMGGVAATACGYGTTTPSPRRRAGTTRPHQQETNRDAGPAPGARPSGTWPCSGPWPPSPSSGARPSPTPRGRRARTCVFDRRCAGARSRPARRRRARAVTPNDSHLFWEYLVQLRAARPPAARDSQPEMLFSPLYSDSAAPRGARRRRGARRGELRR